MQGCQLFGGKNSASQLAASAKRALFKNFLIEREGRPLRCQIFRDNWLFLNGKHPKNGCYCNVK